MCTWWPSSDDSGHPTYAHNFMTTVCTAALDKWVPDFRFQFLVNFFTKNNSLFFASHVTSTSLPGSWSTVQLLYSTLPHMSFHGTQKINMACRGDGINRAVRTREESMGH